MSTDPSKFGNGIRRLNPQLFGRAEAVISKAAKNERELHYQLLDECAKLGWIALHGSMAARTHRTEGEPDFVIIANAGRVFFVECKTAAGKFSKEQTAMLAHARKLGHTIHVVHTLEEFRDAVNR